MAKMSDANVKKLLTEHADGYFGAAGDRYLQVGLFYPRNTDVKAIHVGLMDVRAADDIRVEYDFDRDGWVIKQASIFMWEAGDEVLDSDWQEVAFIQAWGREVDGDDE